MTTLVLQLHTCNSPGSSQYSNLELIHIAMKLNIWGDIHENSLTNLKTVLEALSNSKIAIQFAYDCP